MSELAVGSISGLAANGYVVDVANGSQLTQPGMVLQLVSVVYSTQTTISSSSYVDTGLSASITPSSSSSKVAVLVSQPGYIRDLNTGTSEVAIQLVRDATAVHTVTSIQRTRGSSSSEQAFVSGSMAYLDSPNTTSAITYKTQALNSNESLVFQFTSSASIQGQSSITLMEIAS